jgi:AraC-like DNA-binding protein/mannose-6-phosphate isomerase-like protein (cupin superfamily)
MPTSVDDMMEKRSMKRPVLGGTNKGLRPLQYEYWRVGDGSTESIPLDFWIERAGEYHSKGGEYEATHENHAHASQFYFHLNGKAKIEEGNKVQVVKTGDVIGMPVGVPFRYYSRGVVHYHWFAIPNQWPPLLGHSDRVHWLAHGFDAELESRFVEIRETLILGKPGYSLRAIGIFYEFVARLFERSRPVEVEESAYPEAVRNALIFLQENYMEPYDAAQTAEAVSLSQSHLRALFEKWVGESPQQFHARCRIDEARRLLYQDDLNISQIALRVGFADPRYFSRVFKKITGVPPSRYAADHSST